MIKTVEADDDGLVLLQEVLPSPLAKAGRLPPIRLRAIDERTFVPSTGRPVVFLGNDPSDPTDTAQYLHQITVSRRHA